MKKIFTIFISMLFVASLSFAVVGCKKVEEKAVPAKEAATEVKDAAKESATEGKDACPFRTHWDANHGKCVSNQTTCRPGTHWDAHNRKCVSDQTACPPLNHWNAPRGKCVPNQIPDCLTGEHWNHRLERCETNRR